MRLVIMSMLLLLVPVSHAAKVTTHSVEEMAIYPQFSAAAVVVALNDSEVSAEVSGVVTRVVSQVGERVAKGDLLVEVDAFVYEQAVIQNKAAINAIEARIELAEYQLKQARKLSQQQNVSEELLVQRQAELTSLQAELRSQQSSLALAEYNLSKTNIVAPFSGVVAERMAQLGSQLDPGMPVVRLVATDSPEVSAQIHFRDGEVIALAEALRLELDGQQLPLKLRVITPIVDILSRTQEVRLSFAATAAVVGSNGRLVWQHPHAHLPADLLVRRGDALGLFVAEQGQARFLPLPSAQEGRSVRVDTLPADTRLIVDGRFTLQPNDAIEVE